MKAIVYLLCGLGGSGKSTYAQKLADKGFQKFSLDEYVYNLHGRAVTNLPEDEYKELYRAAKLELDKKLTHEIKKGQPVVLDYGFWRRDSREYYKHLVEENGGQWRLIYLKANPDILWERLNKRNSRIDANAFPVSKDMLQKYIERFEEPNNEGEEIIQQSNNRLS